MNYKLPNDVVLSLADECDGWSILCPDKLSKMGLPELVAESLAEAFESNPDRPTETIFVDGRPVNQLYGIYALDLLGWLANEVGADLSGVRARGRGTRARQYQEAIRAAIGAPPNDEQIA